MATSTVKTIDSKGRLTLGREFAGRAVQVELEATSATVTFCRVIPEREAWLWENETAKAMVDRGLQQAHRRSLHSAPDLAAAFDFAESIADEA